MMREAGRTRSTWDTLLMTGTSSEVSALPLCPSLHAQGFGRRRNFPNPLVPRPTRPACSSEGLRQPFESSSLVEHRRGRRSACRRLVCQHFHVSGCPAPGTSSSLCSRFRCQVHAFEPLPRHAAMFEERTQHVRPRVLPRADMVDREVLTPPSGQAAQEGDLDQGRADEDAGQRFFPSLLSVQPSSHTRVAPQGLGVTCCRMACELRWRRRI